MVTIKEDYCDFETAELLKEKGFDWECIGYYADYEPNDVNYSLLGETNSTWESRCYSAPTLQMVMKWLRDEKNIFIDAYYDCDFGEGYRFSVHKLPKGTTLETHNENYSTYEEACETAIKYCLENLI